MPAKDIFHDAVVPALENDGWKVTHDPYVLRLESENLYIDLGAEKILAAEKGSAKIAVEVKSFVAKSLISAFHEAVEQFINYRKALREQEQDRMLFIAIPEDTYYSLFQKKFVQGIMEEIDINLIVFEPEKKIVLRWKK